MGEYMSKQNFNFQIPILILQLSSNTYFFKNNQIHIQNPTKF